MKTLHFQSTIVESEKINPLFTKVKIHVAYEDENRNESFISRDAFEKAASSASFCPIVGEYSEPLEDFLGHGGKIEITDDSIKYVRTTIPYGVIGTDPPTWETVATDDGGMKEYFTLNGYVWSSRFPELETLIDNPKNHSMEIEILNGNFESIGGKNIYVIQDFVFSGFCILGDNVEPCFENSTISTYSHLNKDKYKEDFKQMMAELKFSLQKGDYKINQHGLEGGNEMEENKELVLEEKQFDAEPPEDEDDGDEVEVTVEVEDNDSDDEDQEDVAEDNQEDLDEEFKMDDKKADTEPDGDENGDDTDNDGDGKYALLESELSQLKESFSLLESEIKELREYKAQKLREEKSVEINAVFESVSSKLTEEELAPFKEKAFEMEIADLKKELFALIGQKEFEKEQKFSVGGNKPLSISILGDAPTETKIEASYASIIKKYNNK